MTNTPAQELPRVFVTRPYIGLTTMQVCAVADATDKEILAVCNRENPSGTNLGWCVVICEDKEMPDCEPVPCESFPERRHFLVTC